jgi:hypothetical protein
MRDIYTKSIRINKAVAVIQRREFIYYANATKYYRYDYSTLSRCIRGLTKTKKQANLF